MPSCNSKHMTIYIRSTVTRYLSYALHLYLEYGTYFCYNYSPTVGNTMRTRFTLIDENPRILADTPETRALDGVQIKRTPPHKNKRTKIHEANSPRNTSIQQKIIVNLPIATPTTCFPLYCHQCCLRWYP